MSLSSDLQPIYFTGFRVPVYTASAGLEISCIVVSPGLKELRKDQRWSHERTEKPDLWCVLTQTWPKKQVEQK